MLLERPQKNHAWCSWSAHKKKHKKHPTSTRLLARRPQKKIHLAARADSARRASELLTTTTDPAHAATRKPGEHPQHAPPLDLSPIFPLTYKTKTKSRERAADATRLRGAIAPFHFGNVAWSACGFDGVMAGSFSTCAAIDGGALRVDGVVAGSFGTVRGVVGTLDRVVPVPGAGRVFHYSMLGVGLSPEQPP